MPDPYQRIIGVYGHGSTYQYHKSRFNRRVFTQQVAEVVFYDTDGLSFFDHIPNFDFWIPAASVFGAYPREGHVFDLLGWRNGSRQNIHTLRHIPAAL